jgi:mutator protein MutT
MKKKVSAIVIVNDKNKILILKRGKDSPSPGLWNFPGGSIDEGETAEEAAVRELKEETDLSANINSLKYLDTYNNRYLTVRFYVTKDYTGEVQINEESEEAAWISLSKMDEYNFVGSKSFIDNLIFEIGKYIYTN